MAVKPSNAINAGNATVNSVNFVDAIDPNNPQVDVRSPQWFSAFSSAWGYADNVAQVGGKSIPYANAVAGSSSVYSMIDSANTSGTINTRDLLGVSSALLGAAAAGIGAAAAAGTAPVRHFGRQQQHAGRAYGGHAPQLKANFLELVRARRQRQRTAAGPPRSERFGRSLERNAR